MFAWSIKKIYIDWLSSVSFNFSRNFFVFPINCEKKGRNDTEKKAQIKEKDIHRPIRNRPLPKYRFPLI